MKGAQKCVLGSGVLFLLGEFSSSHGEEVFLHAGDNRTGHSKKGVDITLEQLLRF
jgi:hypothetical protein